MKVNNEHYHTIWIDPADQSMVKIIDQRRLPFEFLIEEIRTVEDMYTAIRDMHLRGAPLIGAAGAFGIYLAAFHYRDPGEGHDYFREKADYLISSRPTAVNLSVCVERSLQAIGQTDDIEIKKDIALRTALEIAEEEISNCQRIGEFGLPLIEAISKKKKGEAVNILTHCNAGWLACIDYGTATAPLYLAHDKGVSVHVWVDETRPRNQGARLTAWELKQHGVPYTVIADNEGGLLMQQGLVDMVIVGSDRTTRTGDVANKIGTYLKALAAFDNNIPFYVALPSSSIDWNIADGLKEIPIEQRDTNEVRFVEGYNGNAPGRVRITPVNAPVVNHAFDVTPARLVTGLITEKGICKAAESSLLELFPEKKNT